MMVVYHRWLLIVSLALAGCGRGAALPANSASKAVVEDFYGALLRQDWQQAYGFLDPDCQKRWTLQQFTQLACSHIRNLGFVPENVHVQSCQENGTSAIAHIAFTGHAPSKGWRHRDGIVLRQIADNWRVALPPNFGQKL